jgi:hypothetical protein
VTLGSTRSIVRDAAASIRTISELESPLPDDGWSATTRLIGTVVPWSNGARAGPRGDEATMFNLCERRFPNETVVIGGRGTPAEGLCPPPIRASPDPWDLRVRVARR